MTRLKMFLLLAFISVFSFGIMRTAQAEQPKTLILAIGGESESGYDPIVGWGRYGHPLFQSTLLSRDENLNIVNDLATEHKLSDDRLVWQVKIRSDAKFSDGQPLTAEDVVFTFNKASEAAGMVDLSNLKEAVVIGPYELELRLKKPEITFVDYLLKLGIVPKHAYGPDYARKPLGSGPYKFVKWDEGQQLVVEINPDYYGEKPVFERLVFLFMDSDAAFAAAKSGQAHVVAVPQSLAKQKVKKMTIHPVTSVDNRGIMFPMQPDIGKKSKNGFAMGNNVTSDIAIRRAVNYALDRKMLVEGILYGYGSPAYGMVDNLPWDQPEIRFQDNDMEKAKAILKEAGWKDENNDGYLEKNGQKASFKLIYPSSDLTRQSLALAIRDQLKPIGIEVEPFGSTWDDVYNQHGFNSPVLYGWGDNTPLELYQIYHSRTYDDGPDSTSFNVGRYNNPAVDKYLDEAQRAASFEDSLKHWQAAQWDGTTGPAVQGDAAWAWLVNLTHTYFVDDCLDIGKSAIEPHGHGWPITANVTKWKWKCQ